MMTRLVSDDIGMIVSIELVLTATVMVVGLLAGMTAMRDAVVSELSDVAGAVQSFHQGFIYYGVRGHSASTAGGDYVDYLDFCDASEDRNAGIDNCIYIRPFAYDEGRAVESPYPR